MTRLVGLVRRLGPAPESRRVAALSAEALRVERDRDRLDAAAMTAARVVLEAAAGVEHYDSALLRQAADRLGSGGGLAEVLAELPPLPRSAVRGSWRRLLAADPGPIRVTSTSGTGGTRTNAVKPEASFAVRAAVERRWYAGLGLSERVDVHTVVPWDPADRRWQPFHDNRVRRRDVSVPDVLDELRGPSGGPSGLLLSQPDVLLHLAASAAEHRWGRLDAVASSFELPPPASRAALLSAGAPRLTEMYCAADICTPLAFGWPGCTGLHVNEDTVHVEVLGWDGRRRPDGEPGRLTVTDLLNTAMPLIRYQLGDLGLLAGGGCRCGRRTRLLRLLGREATTFRLPGGRVPVGPVLAAVAGRSGDRPFLVEQDDSGITVAGLPGAAADAVREALPRVPVGVREATAAEAALARPGGLAVSTATRIPLGGLR